MAPPNDSAPAPPEVAQLLQRGVSALLAGDARAAAEALDAALKRRAFDPSLHFNLAVALRLRGDLPRALGHARLAAELAGSAPAYVLHGVHLQLAGARERALLCFERALALEPSYRLASMYLALGYREIGRRADAIAGLERALARGRGALPPLVAERVRGQLFDLRRERGPSRPVATSLCAVAVVTEVLLPDGSTASLEPDSLAGGSPHLSSSSSSAPSPSPAPARECDADEIARLLHGASNIVALTGAGASAACGLATRKQLWQRYDRDAAVSAVGFAQSRATLWTVVRDFLGLDDHPPGAVHHAIARLPRLSAIVTQNVDDLHQRAAPGDRSVPVFELHGTLERMVCSACGALAPHPARHYVPEHLTLPPCPACGAALRPDVVLFGEQLAPPVLAAALRAVEACDLLLVVGCALDVAPASELPRVAAARGAAVVELKLSPSRVSDAVGSALLLGPAEETLPAVYARLAALEGLPPLPPSPPARPPAPPRTHFVLPPLGEAIVEGTLSRWTRRVGDAVAPGEIIAELDSDKVTVEIEAPFGGVLRTLVEPSTIVQVGDPIAEVEPVARNATLSPEAAGGARDRVEVSEAPLSLFADFGPHTAAVRRGVAGLDEARWLAPEGPPAALEALVRPLADAHRRALALPAPPHDVWFTDDVREARARWQRDWLAPDERALRPFDEATRAWLAALGAARARVRTKSRALLPPVPPLPHLVHWRVAQRLAHLHGPQERPSYCKGAASAIEAAALHYLAGLATDGQGLEPPCPFAPLVAIWGAGAWPFALPGGVMGVYLPRPGALAEPPPRSILSYFSNLHAFVGLDCPPRG
ncbi:MAG TPA: Sir2 family NAD-dependent protein deacetylase [Polyangiaceae bacterium]|nr:Sir2 family NAD-dependent protein deacetylase [Polyangiaceae bacterium]